jgi:hypothetical protein
MRKMRIETAHWSIIVYDRFTRWSPFHPAKSRAGKALGFIVITYHTYPRQLFGTLD